MYGGMYIVKLLLCQTSWPYATFFLTQHCLKVTQFQCLIGARYRISLSGAFVCSYAYYKKSKSQPETNAVTRTNQ